VEGKFEEMIEWKNTWERNVLIARWIDIVCNY
jgi:hypothetical protein